MSYHLFTLRPRRARKPHRCVWCSLAILPGSIYLREASVYDGAHQDFAWHEACNAAAMDWLAETQETEFVSGNDMPFYALYKLEAAEVATP